jgi:uncharacterized protein YecE (DUF72 family)
VIRFGPAGWSYRDWAGIVYPAPKPAGFDPLAYLAGFFDTIEINSTFYRPARGSSAEKWLERVADKPDFRFTAKLWKRFTHERQEAWSPDDVRQARAAFDPLLDSGKLGALLLQFPWSFRRTDENREWLDDLVREFKEFPLVLEVRHASWNQPEFFRELRDRSIGFVNIDQPLFDNSIEPSARATSPVGYIRVHGRNYGEWFRKDAPPEARYDYLYSAKELKPWAERAEQIAADSRTDDVYVVTNNHFQGKGITNALMLQSMVEGRKVSAPPGLFDEYGEVLKPYARPAA